MSAGIAVVGEPGERADVGVPVDVRRDGTTIARLWRRGGEPSALLVGVDGLERADCAPPHQLDRPPELAVVFRSLLRTRLEDPAVTPARVGQCAPSGL